MKYVLQINTGSFHRSSLSAKEIRERIEKCAEIISVDKVIFGWADDPDLNGEICTFLKQRNIESWLWLPVFSEIYESSPEYPCTEIIGKETAGVDQSYEGEKFEFGCPDTEENLRRAKEVYARLTARCHPDGIFLDRIRYPSAANSPYALYGCWCPACRARYASAGIHAETLREMAERHMMPFPSSFEEGEYHYESEDLELLMKEKAKIIEEDVISLSRFFHDQGYKTGIDVFAPALSPFVAQNLEKLGKSVDFIKPMLYLRTHAPAGIPFETDALGIDAVHKLNALWHLDVMSVNGNAAMIARLNEKGICVIPGVDVSEVPGICDTDPAYAVNMLNALKEAGCASAVLSWDAMKITDEMLEAVSHI